MTFHLKLEGKKHSPPLSFEEINTPNLFLYIFRISLCLY